MAFKYQRKPTKVLLKLVWKVKIKHSSDIYMFFQKNVKNKKVMKVKKHKIGLSLKIWAYSKNKLKKYTVWHDKSNMGYQDKEYNCLAEKHFHEPKIPFCSFLSPSSSINKLLNHISYFWICSSFFIFLEENLVKQFLKR